MAAAGSNAGPAVRPRDIRRLHNHLRRARHHGRAAGAEYQANATTVNRVKGDLNKLGYGHADKKTLVYYDGPYDNPTNCGKGITGQIDGGANGYAVIFLASCSAVVGTGVGGVALTVAHELLHALNALPVPFPTPGPPTVCNTQLMPEPDLGHPCDSTTDVLYPTGNPADTFSTQVLDFGRNDYYAHGQKWWDVQKSLFLQQLNSPDTTPPSKFAKRKVSATSAPLALAATSTKRTLTAKRRDAVTFKWPKAKDGALLGYRVDTNGKFFQTAPDKFFTTKKRKITIADRKIIPRPKKVLELGVRAIDKSGNLGPLTTILFRVGVGIVRPNGKLLKDTVPPSSPKLKKSQISSAGLLLRWGRATDIGGKVTGYRIERNKRTYATVSPKERSFLVPFADARGKWSVRAIDRAKPKKLVSARTQTVTIS